jgi:hypothetical protein
LSARPPRPARSLKSYRILAQDHRLAWWAICRLAKTGYHKALLAFWPPPRARRPSPRAGGPRRRPRRLPGPAARRLGVSSARFEDGRLYLFAAAGGASAGPLRAAAARE